MRAWPLVPLIYCLFGLAIGAGGLFISLTYNPKLKPLAIIDHQPREPKQILPALKINNTPLALKSRNTILAASPFATNRSAFSRLPPVGKSTTPKYNPEFVGTLGKSDNIRAMIVWRAGEPTQIHSIGDDTQWGKLIEITKNKIIFQSKSGKKTLKLF